MVYFIRMNRVCIIAFVSLICFVNHAFSAESPLVSLKNETIVFFTPLTIPVKAINGKTVIFESDGSGRIKKGMRLEVLREGETFLHPVTHEPLGHFESPVGKIEVTESKEGTAKGLILIGDIEAGDKGRITKSKIKTLFYQDKSVDWNLGDAYYREVKKSDRFEMLETAMQDNTKEQLLKEAGKQGAELLMIIESPSDKEKTFLRQMLCWVEDGKVFSDTTIEISPDLLGMVQSDLFLFTTIKNQPLLTYELPIGFEFIAAGDFNGDGSEELVLASSGFFKVYEPSVDLFQLWEFESSKVDEYLRVDSVDLNGNGKHEIVVTALREEEGIYSFIYELNDNEFELLWETEGYLRVMKKRLLFQKDDLIGGFDEDILNVRWNGEFSIGDPLSLPKGVELNIFNFTTVRTSEGEEFVISYDKNNFMNVFDKRGVNVWKSSKDFGGFTRTFKKESPTVMVDRGEWYMSDKLHSAAMSIVAIKRTPLTEKSKSLGYKESGLVKLSWNGFIMDERTLIDEVSGSILDFQFHKEKIFVLSRPLLGLKVKNLLQGENPLVSYLFVYSASK